MGKTAMVDGTQLYHDAIDRVHELRYEISTMRPVVEAAQRWRHTHERETTSGNFKRQQEIVRAVDIYESSKPK